jgi:hypothetical protein
MFARPRICADLCTPSQGGIADLQPENMGNKDLKQKG